MKRFALLGLVFLVACVQIPEQDTQTNDVPAQANTAEADVQKLGTLCTGWNECIAYCQKELPKCEAYCQGTFSDLCRTIFPPRADDNGRATARGCQGTGMVELTHAPMALDQIELIQPIGLMSSNHVTPTDHGYYNANTWTDFSRKDLSEYVPVYAPGDGVVTSIEAMPEVHRSSPAGDYRIVIHHTCTFYTIYIHVNQLSERMRDAFNARKPIEVKGGEVIGAAPGFDFSAHNDEITLPGFIVPETYFAESWKLHNVDMFDVFAEPVRTQLLAKNARQVEPRGGKIDYDIDGKLVGNWFEEDTGGYGGNPTREDRYGYWVSHLSFVYDAYDPRLITVSLGNFAGEPKQFAVVGNAPDPKDVDASDGLVKYELQQYDWLSGGKHWERITYAPVDKAVGVGPVEGVVLVQVLEDRKIKVEVFPGKTAKEVSGFTEKAVIYER